MTDIQTQHPHEPVLMGAGAIAGLLSGWSSIALAIWSIGAIQLYFSPAFLVLGLAALLIFLFSLLIAGFAAGMACTFFWHSTVTEEQLENWRIGVLIALFLPMLYFGLLYAMAAMSLLAPIVVREFNIGIKVGLNWWPQKRWRHLFGLTNDWERDDES